MDMIFIFIAALLAALAFYLIGDFLYWRLKGRQEFAVIQEFQGRKNKGRRLPVVSFEHEGQERKVQVARIDSFSYVIGQFGEGDTVLIIYKDGRPDQARIYGYINIVAGLFLLAPLFMALAGSFGNVRALGQVMYFAGFGAIMIGAWALMKMVQKDY